MLFLGFAFCSVCLFLLCTKACIHRVLITMALKVPCDLSGLPGSFGTAYSRHLCLFFY